MNVYIHVHNYTSTLKWNKCTCTCHALVTVYYTVVGVVGGVANLLSTAVSQVDHGRVYALIKNFVKFRTKLVDP